MKQETNVKTVIAMDNVIRKQRFNSFLKGREKRPTESCMAILPHSDQSQTDGSYWKDWNIHEQEATPLIAHRYILRHQNHSKNSEEEWLNQWKVWAGNTLRLQTSQANHTVGGDGTPQKHKAENKDPTQKSSKTYGWDSSCYGTTKELDHGTGISTGPESSKILSKIRTKSRGVIRCLKRILSTSQQPKGNGSTSMRISPRLIIMGN